VQFIRNATGSAKSWCHFSRTSTKLFFGYMRHFLMAENN